MNKILTSEELFNANKIVPVIVLNDIDKAILVANALNDGGINVMEVTLRTPNALQIIEKLAKEAPYITVGAGTVLSEDQYHMAVKHGAKFIVSPGLTPELAKVKGVYNVPFVPGAITPTEVMYALQYGIDILKFFPAESYNGHMALKSLASVFPKVKFCPTGGINLENANKYLSLSNVVGVGCSFIVTEQLVAQNNFEKITELAKAAAALCKQ
ncbi:MAG: bifunctional 4-hydroxy-2-oxoglutarate aldolase/2-dehydro-3-deoxy-phosphogluconate aldolase [Proteobacteria bacterium]|jgi:2-dehydro-3-deoxyphosphogluconate aldolase/(4S)-4-hydroxy-2-oxoglutarate aldolase|nr:bifunctional 4-hydroxy-2-oxoglutarate aldolase/2-dehydro-3-deoxy-phosphogluconate aldolase [Pseudomonadota bacterium]